MATPALNLLGKKFGLLTALSKGEKKGLNGELYWNFLCECGKFRLASGSAVKQGRLISCGCSKKAKLTTHGQINTRTYRIWAGMVNRCKNPKNNSYKSYGGRGITVTEEWEKYVNFFSSMGECPAGHSIERIDNNGNYTPMNCEWIPLAKQARNRRSNVYFEWEGQKMTLREVAEKVGISYSCLYQRVRAGHSLANAVTGKLKHKVKGAKL
jgi:hypothetical protein